jgi:DNA-binding LacI/PurR family transcriptional regulator
VSKGAVSFALNGRPGVASGTRERVFQAARALGWEPDLRARSLTSRRAYALGLVVARPPRLLGADPFFPAFIAGVESELAPRRLALVLQVVTDAEAERDGYRKLAADRRVDGVLLADLRVRDPRIALVSDLGLPAVTLNRPLEPCPLPAICADEASGVTALVDHLVSLGHTRIGHVAGPRQYVHGRGRRAAWRQALARHDLPPGPVRHGDFAPASGARATRALLDCGRPPTAIVYGNDLMAIGGLAVLQQRGIRVPDDISVTGFDNNPVAGYVSPPLTTVHIDAYTWGRCATRTLLELVERGRAGDVTLCVPEVIVRASTGPARERTSRSDSGPGRSDSGGSRRQSPQRSGP